MPRHIYYTFVKLIEQAHGSKTTPPAQTEVMRARNFVYHQIEVINYLLYQRDDTYSPASYTDIFGPAKRALRIVAQFSFHLALWLVIFVLLALVYVSAKNGTLFPVYLAATILAAMVFLYYYRKRRTHLQLLKKLGV
jgi:hypothetical protein